MADISKIALPNGTQYDLKDETARTQAMNELSRWMAIYAVNLSDIEDEVGEQSEQNTEALTMMRELARRMEELGIRPLNSPNMIGQNFFTDRAAYTYTDSQTGEEITIPAYSNIPYGDTYKVWGTSCPYVDSFQNATTVGTDPDEISVAVVNLDSENQVNDTDGKVYTKALAFTVTNPPAQGQNNADKLIYNYGNHGAGEVNENLKDRGSLDLEVGHTYTMSCLARITSGTNARLLFSYSPTSSKGETSYQDITGTEWQRVHWTFTFNPSGDQYNDYASTKTVTVTDPDTGETTTQTVSITRRQALWTKTVAFGVCRAYAGTVQLCGFRLTKGGLYQGTAYDEMLDEMVDLKARVARLEADVAELKAANEEHIDLDPVEIEDP